jgi:hypothetical protein
MTKADRQALRKRLDRVKTTLDAGTGIRLYTGEQLWQACARAVRRERKRVLSFCHDCGGEVVAEPVLCEACVARRNGEGMDTDDMRTIEQWRRT